MRLVALPFEIFPLEHKYCMGACCVIFEIRALILCTAWCLLGVSTAGGLIKIGINIAYHVKLSLRQQSHCGYANSPRVRLGNHFDVVGIYNNGYA